MAQIQHHGLSEYDRFFKWIEVGEPNECWRWIGSRKTASGKAAGKPPVLWHGQWRSSDGRIELAHRASWRLLKGTIPNDMCVLHRCDNPICVNPSHLFIGTQADNVKDMWSKGRARPKSNIGAKHGMSKVTEELVLSIRSSKESGVELAQRLGITPTTVCDIRKRRTWKHLV